jgi:hypothetical protein
MKKLACLMALGALAVGMAGAQAQNILSNGTLDVISVQNQLGSTPDDWIVDATRTITGTYNDGAASEPWAGPSPTPDTNPGDFGVFFKPFTGNVTDGPATVHLYQDNVATPGVTYKLTGWAGAEPNYLSLGSEFALEFLNGASIIGTTTTPLSQLFVDNGESFDYKPYSVTALAPAGTTHVRARASMLGASNNPLGGGQAFVVDDFTLVAIPEPASCGLMGLALVGMGLVHRRRK